VMRLPARQRQVVALRLVLDLDTARTAEVLASRPARSWPIWGGPWPRCAATFRPNDRRRPDQER
jgi:hypothetical protein